MLARRQFLQGLAIASGALPLSTTTAFSSASVDSSAQNGSALTPQTLEDALGGQ